jgi:hypothetical protein
MTEDELNALRKEARKAKRIASEWAGQMHDLVEDRLPAAYREIPAIAQATIEACEAWEKAEATLEQAEKETA